MRRGYRTSNPFLVGAVVLAVICVLTYLGFTKSNPFANRFEIKAAFKTANDLKPKSPVRIGGVNVGKVTKIEPVRGGNGVVVTMRIDDRSVPIKRDARMKIRPRIFLEGNYFVDVRPGTPSAPELDEDAVIPVQQTATPVQFGQVLSILQSDTREDVRSILHELGRAFDRGGALGYNRSIQHQKPAFQGGAQVNQALLGIEEHDLSGYIRGAGKVAEALDRNDEQLKSLITDFAATASAFAQEGRNLSAAIRELPNTLQRGQRAFGALNRAFPPFRRFVREFRPTVRSANPALTAQIPFMIQARGLVSRNELQGLARDLRPTVPNLVELNRGSVGVQREIRQLSSCQNNVVIPWSSDRVPDPNFAPSGPVYQEAPKAFPGLAGESRSFDANGQYVRTLAQSGNFAYPLGDGRFFFTTTPLQGVNPPKKLDGRPPLEPNVPCETQQRPDLRSIAQAPPQAIKVNHDSPAALARYEQAKQVAVQWLGDLVGDLGLPLKVKGYRRETTRERAGGKGADVKVAAGAAAAEAERR